MLMDPNDYKTIENFVRALEQASQIIQRENPDCIIAPMFGAVPFIDCLNIIDGEFPNHKVIYVPASNKVHRLKDVLRGTFENVIDEFAPDGGTFLSIDEVVSGNSLMRVYKQFDAARTNYANKKTVAVYGDDADFTKKTVHTFRDAVRDSIQYKSIGIVDSRMDKGKKQRNPEYEKLVAEGIVIPVETPCIVTMDRVDFFPAQYKRSHDTEGKTVYLPVIEGFTIAPEYTNFLTTVAAIVGKDPDMVTVNNLGKIQAAYKWVPEHLRAA